MKRRRLGMRLAVAAAIALAATGAAFAGVVHGTVKNGTTGKSAAGVKLILLALQGGMQPVGETVSDAQGQFAFDNAGLGAQPMLVRAVYKDVNFHTPAPPGKSDLEITVFEPTQDPQAISISSRVVIFQPNGDKLIVGEEYTVDNNSQPPKAFYKGDGSFVFTLPANATLQQIAAAGPSGMPVVQAPIEKKNHQVATAFAFRPGQSTVRCSYEIPYPGNAALVSLPASYAVARLILVAPPSMQIAGEGLQAGGQEQGMNIYGRENLAANSVVTVSVSGTAPAPSATQDAGGVAQPGDAAESGAQIQVIPGRLDPVKWGIILGAVAVFALGAILLGKKQVIVNMPANGASAVAAVAVPAAANALANGNNAKSPLGPAAPKAGEQSAISQVDAQVGSSLDALKDRLFRLELRRQAGTIGEAEYARERDQTEQILRELVKG